MWDESQPDFSWSGGRDMGNIAVLHSQIMDLTISPLTTERWPALEDLFGKAGASNGCWCMYWRIGPRYRERSHEENKRELGQLAASGRSPGLLALDGDVAVGWCELAPRSDLAWLAHTRYLQAEDASPVWSIPCFYTRRTHRGRGVMDLLVASAVLVAAEAGAPALEAYPVDTAVPGHTRNLFPGVASVFARHGFQVVARRKPDRPVMRKRLASA
jgi:GNAT superfamily N-acetyltransferase